MNPKSILIVSNKGKIKVKNSITLDISLDTNIHGYNIVDYVDNFIQKLVTNNSDIEWIIFDIELNSNSLEDMIIVNSYLPHYIYNKYQTYKIIFTSSGLVFGNENWNKTEIDNHCSDNIYSKSISMGEVIGERSWVIRYDLFDDSLFNKTFKKDKIYYGSIDTKYSFITYKSLNKIIEAIIDNYNKIKSGVYHIVPKDTHTEYEILNYICWKNKYNCYIERSSSILKKEKFLKSSKINILKTIWNYAGYDDIPTFKLLLNEI